MLQTIINNASSTFQTTTTFGLSSVVDFMKGLINLVIGAGLGVLQQLMPWIVALAVISAIVYFLYRAFKFFQH